MNDVDSPSRDPADHGRPADPWPGDGLLGIVHVVDSLELGGLERVVTDLAIEQAAHGHRVIVFSIAGGGSFEADLDAAGVRWSLPASDAHSTPAYCVRCVAP